jgi:acetylornithine deacetylase/succinyl-diaminopimelate desuccinylase-like protein
VQGAPADRARRSRSCAREPHAGDLDGDARHREADDTILLYGHLDKQPEMTGWSEGLGPWTPVLRGDRLYGRGGADDGYARSPVADGDPAGCSRRPAARALRVLIEACEESAASICRRTSKLLAPRIGTPSLVVCLDSGCGNYEQLWCTTSLRGLVARHARVEPPDARACTRATASRRRPSSFRIAPDPARAARGRRTGQVRIERASTWTSRRSACAGRVGRRRARSEVWRQVPVRQGRPTDDRGSRRADPEPHLAAGARGDGRRRHARAIGNAGNVLRPFDAAQAVAARAADGRRAEGAGAGQGDCSNAIRPTAPRSRSPSARRAAPAGTRRDFAPWLDAALDEPRIAAVLRQAAGAHGRRRLDPVHGHARRAFPEAQFIITGVLGPASNAHGPNEFLHIPTGKALTACVADVIARHATR